MSSVATLQPEPTSVVACTISRDVQNFDLLIDDMERALGESWGDVDFDEALIFLGQPEAATLEFVAIAVDKADEGDLKRIIGIIHAARARGIKVILIADHISPTALHQLLRLGAEDFVPYPLPDGALHDAIERIRKPAPTSPAVATAPVAHTTAVPAVKAKGNRDGVLLPVHGLSGGVGATTFATNLAWELATISKTDAPRVCLIDLDLQYGSISTYLDLPRREAVYEILSDAGNADSDHFLQSMQTFNDRLHVFTSPAEMLPLDIIGPEDVTHLIQMAQDNFDFVVIDMPTTVVAWTETVLSIAHVYFALIELDLRSAQNVLRLLRALKAEDLPYEKFRFVLNRAPGFTDLSARSRVKRMSESLDITIEVQLPDGNRQVTQANDHGQPLAIGATKNPLRREIQKLAKQLHDLTKTVETGKGK